MAGLLRFCGTPHNGNRRRGNAIGGSSGASRLACVVLRIICRPSPVEVDFNGLTAAAVEYAAGHCQGEQDKKEAAHAILYRQSRAAHLVGHYPRRGIPLFGTLLALGVLPQPPEHAAVGRAGTRLTGAETEKSFARGRRKEASIRFVIG